MILDNPDVEVVASQVVDAGEYLLRLHRAGSLKTDFRPLDLDVAYHTPCHLKALQCGTPLADLLTLIPQLRLHRIEKGCSGMAGAYGLTERNFANSIRIGWGLITAMRDPDLNFGRDGVQRLQVSNGAGDRDADDSSAQITRLRLRLDARNRTQATTDQSETRHLMKVEVRLFARARDAAGAERVTVELPRVGPSGRFASRPGCGISAACPTCAEFACRRGKRLRRRSVAFWANNPKLPASRR